jgi:hypothetical protein
MKTYSDRGVSKVSASDRDDLRSLYREVRRLRKLLGVLNRGSLADPASSTAVDGLDASNTVH